MLLVCKTFPKNQMPPHGEGHSGKQRAQFLGAEAKQVSRHKLHITAGHRAGILPRCLHGTCTTSWFTARSLLVHCYSLLILLPWVGRNTPCLALCLQSLCFLATPVEHKGAEKQPGTRSCRTCARTRPRPEAARPPRAGHARAAAVVPIVVSCSTSPSSPSPGPAQQNQNQTKPT